MVLHAPAAAVPARPKVSKARVRIALGEGILVVGGLLVRDAVTVRGAVVVVVEEKSGSNERGCFVNVVGDSSGGGGGGGDGDGNGDAECFLDPT